MCQVAFCGPCERGRVVSDPKEMASVKRESDKEGRAPTYPVFLFLEKVQTGHRAEHDISFCSIAKPNEGRHCQSY